MKKTKLAFTLFVTIAIIIFACSCQTNTSIIDLELGATASIPLINKETNAISIAPTHKNSCYYEDDTSHNIHFYEYALVSPVLSKDFFGINLHSAVGFAYDFDIKNSELMMGPALTVSGTMTFNPIKFNPRFGLALFSDYKYFFNEKYFLNAQLEFSSSLTVSAFVGVGIRI